MIRIVTTTVQWPLFGSLDGGRLYNKTESEKRICSTVQRTLGEKLKFQNVHDTPLVAVL